jgi:hypothetical protein
VVINKGSTNFGSQEFGRPKSGSRFGRTILYATGFVNSGRVWFCALKVLENPRTIVEMSL